MVLFNYSTKELTAKVVYYGPGLCGKTTNLQYVHENLPQTVKGKMLSLATKTDRTLFFDFLPLDLGTIRGMKTRIQLYTVPGQVFYNETRKLVLKGADGIVFVADSQEQMLQANVESFRNLEENLRTHGMNLAEMPHVIQFNKRDLPKIASVEEMNAAINRFNAPFYESVATTGIGVQDSLKAITKLVLLHLTKKYDPKTGGGRRVTTGPPSRPSEPAVRATPPVASSGDAGIPLSGADDGAPSISAAAQTPPAAEVPAFEPAPPVQRTGPPPPPDFHGRADDEPAAPEFDAEDVDGFMAEVEDPVAPPSPEAPVAAEPTDDALLSPFPLPAEGEGDDALDDQPAEEPDEVPSTASTPFADLQDGAGATDEDGPEPVPLDGFDDMPATAEPHDEPTEDIVPLAASSVDDGPAFEIDPGFGSTGAGLEASTPEPAPETRAPSFRFDVGPDEAEEEPALPSPLEAEPDDAPIELTEVADDRSLFEDPGLDVARLAAGHAKEIVVPVELGDGTGVRRFKLSVTLKLDPVD